MPDAVTVVSCTLCRRPPTPGMKTCERCRKARRAIGDRWRARHPDRQKAQSAEQRARHRAKRVLGVQQWRRKNPAAASLAYRRANLKRYAGMTIERFDALAEQQGHRCAICRGLEGPTYRTRLVVDHDHKSGAVRGLLCHRCNLCLGMLRERPDLLAAATAYLGRTHAPA